MILDPLFSNYTVKSMDLKNRFVMAPMTRFQSPDGIPNEIVGEYYRRRAAGGIGLIITEGTLVDHPLASHQEGIPRIAQDTVDAWRQVLGEINQTHTPTFVQLWHQGPKAQPGIGAISVEEDGKQIVHGANEKDREDIFNAFVKGAVLAKKIGFDGVEFHGAHGYLLDSFLREGHVDFVSDIVRETRRLVGPDYPLCMRFSQWKVARYEDTQFQSPTEMENVLLPLKDAGIDIFHASTRRFWLPEFEGSDMNLAGWTKKITGCPTITVGNIGLVKEEFFGTGPESLHEVMRRFDNGEFDMVAIGRPLLSDAEWTNKVHAGLVDELIDHYKGVNQVYP
ncbi:MAG: 12-oxophytodienoate reductase [Candidatus Latescibacteria bacterium]|jgi:2,4-dienoyl-CoA reductase-like NADH-dependent reductase (Old Yellow Enzyme family)|nr:12-oxophytodienoate reductase [Candidatus Latescibacterota bacterium]